MSQSHRLDGRGSVDRTRPLTFSFNGKKLKGYQGDTLASALLANGVKLVGRSFKYHRPRGIFSCGSEEPNALVTLRTGAHAEPNRPATTIELFDGLEAASQNHFGPLKHDLLAANDLMAPFFGAGFYYKTFMWPARFWEKIYEPMIRRAAGLGRLSLEEDPDTYAKGFLHCDILVIGGGPSGLSAALTAARSGAKVILADEDFRFGGRLTMETMSVDDMSGSDWIARTLDELSVMPNVRLLPRTTVFGAFDHGIFGALERKTDHLSASEGQPRQILWRVYAKRSILCAGATERSIAFTNNDRPGIMLAGAVRAYANRYGALAGKRVAVLTNNDDGWRTARDLVAAGSGNVAVIDTRSRLEHSLPAGTDLFQGKHVINTSGRHGLTSITLSNQQVLNVDCLAVAGGWNPNVHLTCHQRSRPQWREDLAAFVPGRSLPVGMRVAGAANGALTLGKALQEGQVQSLQALSDLGIETTQGPTPRADDEASAVSAFWHAGGRQGAYKRAWVDLQNDVTVKDVRQSHREGFRSVEHLKRYTTLGMATDQGKTANILGLAVMAEASGKSIPETGTTIFRPPYTPVPIGAFAGSSRGRRFRPTRHTPSHQWAQQNGAVFTEVGNWLRAQWYPQAGETHWRESVDREVLQTRASVGICDVTTLGKIDVQGRDAAAFLNGIYANAFGKLAVGKVRYGLMLREDGIAMDDGTAARFSDTHFVVTTTTANAVSVFRHMEFCRQCLWPDMDVHLISTTEQWAQFAVAGPNARKLLRKIVDAEFDISNDAFPFMACGQISVCNGTPARLFRISFSGELAYEIAVPTRFGNAMMAALTAAGEEFGAVPYGTEALSVMRIEKGHAAGNELCGTTTARDLGLGRMVSRKKDCIGNSMSERPGLNREDGLSLVGFRPVDREQALSAGSHFVGRETSPETKNDEGWMTSVCYSPSLGHSIGLGFIRNGDTRFGETVTAANPLQKRSIDVEIVSPHFIDPEGERLRG
jgi:sarcosine oxidase subunit alpha